MECLDNCNGICDSCIGEKTDAIVSTVKDMLLIATEGFDLLGSNLVGDDEEFILFVSEQLKSDPRIVELQEKLYTYLTYLVCSYADRGDLEGLRLHYRVIASQLSGWQRIHLYNFIRMVNFLQNQEYEGNTHANTY